MEQFFDIFGDSWPVVMEYVEGLHRRRSFTPPMRAASRLQSGPGLIHAPAAPDHPNGSAYRLGHEVVQVVARSHLSRLPPGAPPSATAREQLLGSVLKPTPLARDNRLSAHYVSLSPQIRRYLAQRTAPESS